MVLIDKPEEAIARLEAATSRAPREAKAWSDLAAARYAAAALRGRTSLLPEALAAVERALAIEPRLPEARFNRALILGRLGLTQQARRAWQAYLEVDNSSPWATEARQRLATIPVTTGDAEFRRELPRLESAAVANDKRTVVELVQRHPQQSRANAEGDHLGRWGAAVRRGDAAEAVRLLAICRQIGDALAPLAGETLLRDVVRATIPPALRIAHCWPRGTKPTVAGGSHSAGSVPPRRSPISVSPPHAWTRAAARWRWWRATTPRARPTSATTWDAPRRSSRRCLAARSLPR